MVSASKILCGRAIALIGAVTMDNNVVSNDCANGGDYGTDLLRRHHERFDHATGRHTPR